MITTDKEVGGSHYKSMDIQPIEFILKNNLGFCEGNVIKYITRFRHLLGLKGTVVPVLKLNKINLYEHQRF